MKNKTKKAIERHTNGVAHKKHQPIMWDIRGWHSNWDWKVRGNKNDAASTIVHQTRFPERDLALLYRGVGDAAVFIATISNKDYPTVISFPSTTTNEQNPPFEFKNTAGLPYHWQWSVRVQALGGRELKWEFTHPPCWSDCIHLRDPVTADELGVANSNYMELKAKLPRNTVEELVITGTAAMIAIAPYMHNDMPVAAQGPEGGKIFGKTKCHFGSSTRRLGRTWWGVKLEKQRGKTCKERQNL